MLPGYIRIKPAGQHAITLFTRHGFVTIDHQDLYEISNELTDIAEQLEEIQ